MQWLKETFGKDNLVSAVLHLDETTPHIHATIVPIVTGERRKKSTEKNDGKKKYRKKDTSATRLCADDVMSRVKLKEYQNSYACSMADYGLMRGVEGSEAKHVKTSQYYRDLLNMKESVQENISLLIEQQKQAKVELAKVKADVSKERFKNSASGVGAKLLDGVGSLLGTPKMTKVENENEELKKVISRLENDKVLLINDFKLKEKNLSLEVMQLSNEFKIREQELKKKNATIQSMLDKIFKYFPIIQELLRVENICKTIGFGEKIIGKLFDFEKVGFHGELYYPEYRKKFKTEHSVAEITKNKTTPDKLSLVIDGKDYLEWLEGKRKEENLRKGLDNKHNRRMKI